MSFSQWANAAFHKFPLASTPTVSVVKNKTKPRGGFWAVRIVSAWNTQLQLGKWEHISWGRYLQEEVGFWLVLILFDLQHTHIKNF